MTENRNRLVESAIQKIKDHARGWFEKPYVGSAFIEHTLTPDEIEALDAAYPDGFGLRMTKGEK